MTAAALFPEPERVEIPDELAGWSVEQLDAGMVGAHRIGDWEAVHRVMVALLDRPPYADTLLGLIVQAVLAAHQPERLYRDCRHFHEAREDGSLPDGVFWLNEDLELVCEAGYEATVCAGCGLDEHGEWISDAVWPCPTFRPAAQKLIESLAVPR